MQADAMALACSYCVPIDKNPGVLLGTVAGNAGARAVATK